LCTPRESAASRSRSATRDNSCRARCSSSPVGIAPSSGVPNSRASESLPTSVGLDEACGPDPQHEAEQRAENELLSERRRVCVLRHARRTDDVRLRAESGVREHGDALGLLQGALLCEEISLARVFVALRTEGVGGRRRPGLSNLDVELVDVLVDAGDLLVEIADALVKLGQDRLQLAGRDLAPDPDHAIRERVRNCRRDLRVLVAHRELNDSGCPERSHEHMVLRNVDRVAIGDVSVFEGATDLGEARGDRLPRVGDGAGLGPGFRVVRAQDEPGRRGVGRRLSSVDDPEHCADGHEADDEQPVLAEDSPCGFFQFHGCLLSSGFGVRGVERPTARSLIRVARIRHASMGR
jgi:hypothetical protein